MGKLRDALLGGVRRRRAAKADAAAYCGCSEDAFDTWVMKGLVPGAIPGTERWDREAIDWYLDRASGLATEATASSDPLADWLASERKAVRD